MKRKEFEQCIFRLCNKAKITSYYFYYKLEKLSLSQVCQNLIKTLWVNEIEKDYDTEKLREHMKIFFLKGRFIFDEEKE